MLIVHHLQCSQSECIIGSVKSCRSPKSQSSARTCPHCSVPLSPKRCKGTYPTPGTETLASPTPHAPLPAPPPSTIHSLTCLRPSHPQGSAPIIQDGAITLAESNAIVKYVLTLYGRGQLQVAPDAPNYTDYLYWLHFGNGTTLPGISHNMTFSFTGLPPSHRLVCGWRPWRRSCCSCWRTALCRVRG